MMDFDTDTMQSSDDSGNGGDSSEYGDSVDTGGGTGDSDGGAEEGTTPYTESYGWAAGSGDGGDGSMFDPSSAANSLTGSLGDAATSVWHAVGHAGQGLYDLGASTVHGVEAAADAFWGDREATTQRMDQAAADAQDMRNQFRQAGQDFWGS